MKKNKGDSKEVNANRRSLNGLWPETQNWYLGRPLINATDFAVVVVVAVAVDIVVVIVIDVVVVVVVNANKIL